MSLVKFNYYNIKSSDTIKEKVIIFINNKFKDGITEFYQIPGTNKKTYMKLIKREAYDKGVLYGFQILLSNKNIKDYAEVKDSGELEKTINLSESNSGLNKLSKETLHFLIFIKDKNIKLMVEKIPFGVGINTIKNFLTEKSNLDKNNEEIIFRLCYGNNIIQFLNDNKSKKLSLFRFKPYRRLESFGFMATIEGALKELLEKTQEVEISATWDKQESKTLLEIFQDYFSIQEDYFDENFDFNDFLKIFTIKIEGDSKSINLKEKILFDKSKEDKSYYLDTDAKLDKLYVEIIDKFKTEYSDNKLEE